MNNKLKLIILISIITITFSIILVVFFPENKDELPTHLGLGPAPGMDLDVGEKVPQFITTGNSENPAWTKYKDTLILKDYDNLHVFLDSIGEEDIILSMNPMNNSTTVYDVLYSGEFIWITIAPYVSDPAEGFDTSYYSTMDLNDDQTLIRINNQTSGPVSGMVQLVDFDGIKGTILPLDLWFMSDDYSYTIRGHITESEAIQLANIMLVIEQR